MKKADPAVPAELHDRAGDNWRPLITIADVAGGEWPETARRAALALSGVAEDSETAGVLLLRDIRAYFIEHETDRVLTSHLIEHLASLEESPWSGWNRGKAITPRQVAKLLNPFSVLSKDIRYRDERGKGYQREDFQDAFSRYLPSRGNLSVTAGQANNGAGFRDFSSVTGENDVTAKKDGKSSIHAACPVVTDKKGVEVLVNDDIPLLEAE